MFQNHWIWIPASSPPLMVPCRFSFVSLSIGFVFSSGFWTNSTNSVSMLITSVLNCASYRLAIYLLLSCIISGALICSFIWAIFFLSWCACYVKGQNLRCPPGGVMAVAALWQCTWGRVPIGSNGAYSTLCRISVTPSTTHSRPLWVSPTNSSVRLGVSPTAASTPTGVFTQRFEALFPLH